MLFIYNYSVLAVCNSHYLLFVLTDVECGGGFYVRSLVDDLGKGKWLKLSLVNTDDVHL